MISFPLIRELNVRGYPLYPGPHGDKVMDIPLGNGPWLILGVNGLGKSTLLLLMRYLLSGPVRLREAGFAGERSDLTVIFNRFFAVRVADDARGATATIKVEFGSKQLTLTRDLSNLALLSAQIDDIDNNRVLVTEGEYRLALADLMNLATFDDAVRVLDYVTFFPEARLPLVWNLAAQFELFRGILTPEKSAELRKREAEIVSADSAARNLNAGIARVISRRNAEAKKAKNVNATLAKIAAQQAAYDEAVQSEIKLRSELDAREEERDDTLLLVKRAERDVDDASRGYEKLKYDAFRNAFEGVTPTEQYLFLRLMSDRICHACEQPAPEAAELLRHRVEHHLCPVCGNPKKATSTTTSPEDLGDAAEEAYERLQYAREILAEHLRVHDEHRRAIGLIEQSLSEFRAAAQSHSAQLRTLRRQLPLEDSTKLEEEEARLVALREQVEIFRKDREDAEEKIESLISGLKEATESIRKQLEERFNAVAKPFFAEKVRLVYAPREARIGQQGKVFSFPAFEVEMTSGASQGQFVRRHLDQVSLSQREYLDLIFRMALIDVLGAANGTLAVDGPEGSVDAVFAERAGDLFAGFGANPGKNVILACNIVEGGFIPHTLQDYRDDPRSRVVNLLDQAVPTAALRELRPRYQAKVDEIIERSRAG